MKTLLALAAVMATLQLSGCASHPDRQSAVPAALVSQTDKSAAERLGIEVTAMGLSAAGYMIDLRYRVLDPEKAAPLLSRKIRPHLVDETSGAVLAVPNSPKLGAIRQTDARPKIGREYFVLFANPGRLLQPGARVSLVMGDTKLENLTVQ